MSVVLVGLGAVIASTVQATTGLGFALILTPVLFATMAPIDGIVTTTALGLMLNLLVLLGERRRPPVVWPEVIPIVLAIPQAKSSASKAAPYRPNPQVAYFPPATVA